MNTSPIQSIVLYPEATANRVNGGKFSGVSDLSKGDPFGAMRIQMPPELSKSFVEALTEF